MKAPSFDAIAESRIFADLPSAILRRLAAASEQVSLSPGEALLGGFRAENHDVYIVIEGRIRIAMENKPAGDVTLGEVGPGGLVGEFAAISGRAGSAIAQACTPTALIRIPRQEFLAVVAQHPEVALSLLKHLIDLVRALDERVIALKVFDQAVNVTLDRLFLATL